MITNREIVLFQLSKEMPVIDLSLFPELEKAAGFWGGPHHDEDILTHLYLACSAISRKRPLLRLAALLHDCGKPACYSEGKFRGHDRESARMADAIMRRLGFPEDEIAYVKAIILIHMANLARMRPCRLKIKLKELEKNGASWRDFVRMRIADKKANLKHAGHSFSIRYLVEKCRGALNVRDQQPKSDLAISGYDVMRILRLEPGPAVGKALARIRSMIEAEEIVNDRDILLAEIEKMSGKPGIISYGR